MNSQLRVRMNSQIQLTWRKIVLFLQIHKMEEIEISNSHQKGTPQYKTHFFRFLTKKWVKQIPFTALLRTFIYRFT
jgi:hypothetical protein